MKTTYDRFAAILGTTSPVPLEITENMFDDIQKDPMLTADERENLMLLLFRRLWGNESHAIEAYTAWRRNHLHKVSNG
jgi:hypothetical protein